MLTQINAFSGFINWAMFPPKRECTSRIPSYFYYVLLSTAAFAFSPSVEHYIPAVALRASRGWRCRTFEPAAGIPEGKEKALIDEKAFFRNVPIEFPATEPQCLWSQVGRQCVPPSPFVYHRTRQQYRFPPERSALRRPLRQCLSFPFATLCVVSFYGSFTGPAAGRHSRSMT
jgi:hypothetical protein